jgi:hypothetical protein
MEELQTWVIDLWGKGDVVNLHYINYKYITLGLSPVVDGQ